MSIRKTDTIMRLEKIQEGVMDEMRLGMLQSKKSKDVSRLKESIDAVGKFYLVPSMTENNKIYLLRAIFCIKGHAHRHLKGNKGFKQLMKHLDKIETKIMGWKDETK